MTNAFHSPGSLRLLLAGLLIASIPVATQAAERGHDAHEHGVSAVKLAVDGDSVEIELRSPGADIVGFEHQPATEPDKAAVKKAAGILAKGADLFVPAPAAGCRLINTVVDAPGIESEGMGHKHDAHHEQGEGKQDHGHGHGHQNENHAEPEKQVEDGHSEFSAIYRFHCRAIDKLTHFDVMLFDRFPAARELEVQAITPTGQIVRELKPGSTRLVF